MQLVKHNGSFLQIRINTELAKCGVILFSYIVLYIVQRASEKRNLSLRRLAFVMHWSFRLLHPVCYKVMNFEQNCMLQHCLMYNIGMVWYYIEN